MECVQPRPVLLTTCEIITQTEAAESAHSLSDPQTIQVGRVGAAFIKSRSLRSFLSRKHCKVHLGGMMRRRPSSRAWRASSTQSAAQSAPSAAPQLP